MPRQFAVSRRNLTINKRIIQAGIPVPLAAPFRMGDSSITLNVDGKSYTEPAACYDVKEAVPVGKVVFEEAYHGHE